MKWMRDRAKRRSAKKKTNPEAESTGRVGQEKPALQSEEDAPLVPRYDLDQHADDPDNEFAGEARVDAEDAEDEPEGAAESAASDYDAAPDIAASDPRVEVETQPESQSMPPAAPAAATQQDKQARAPKGVVVLAIGLPGSGKTTWFKRRGVLPLSSDMLRTMLFDSITEQRYQGLVFSTLRSLLRARLIAKMPWNYVDATNLSPQDRKQWIKMAKSFGYEVHAVFFDVPLEVCMDRNRRRERQVNEEVMRRMSSKLRPPKFEEGFSKIVVVRVKRATPDTGEPQ